MGLFKKHMWLKRKIIPSKIEPASRLEIILYHVVSDRQDPFNSSGHNVAPADFEVQLAYLRDHFQLIPLNKVGEIIGNGDANDGPYAAVCFDDGYKSNLIEAYPIMEKLQVPATMFICGLVLDNANLLWRDMVRFLTDQGLGQDFIAYLKKKTDARPYKFGKLRKKTFYSWSKDPKSIGDMQIIDDLMSYFTVRQIDPAKIAMSYDLFIHTDDIRAYPYLDFGNHTFSHPLLTCLDAPGQYAEIEKNHKLIQGRGVESVGLAVPFKPYNQDTLTACRKVGYRMIFTEANSGNSLRMIPEDGVFVLSRRMAPLTLDALRGYLGDAPNI